MSWHHRGFRFRVQYSVPGNRRRKIDIAFPRQRLAIYIDGCFWHGCLDHQPTVKRNGDYWAAKFAGNRVRDAATDQHLVAEGWRVLRFWEHEPLEDVVERIVETHAAPRSTALRGPDAE